MLKGTRTDHPLLSFHPIDGLEATEDIGYVKWLLAGGAPIAEFHAVAWAATVPGGLNE
jgi:hypothetical protein